MVWASNSAGDGYNAWGGFRMSGSERRCNPTSRMEMNIGKKNGNQRSIDIQTARVKRVRWIPARAGMRRRGSRRDRRKDRHGGNTNDIERAEINGFTHQDVRRILDKLSNDEVRHGQSRSPSNVVEPTTTKDDAPV